MGCVEGALLGTLLGNKEGVALGTSLGSIEGEADGTPDGKELGTLLGNIEGDDDEKRSEGVENLFKIGDRIAVGEGCEGFELGVVAGVE